MYYLLSLKWSKNKDQYVWWGPNGSGYYTDLNKAGKYSKEDIEGKLSFKNKDTYPVPVDVVEEMLLQRVVPTITDNWNAMNINLDELREY